FSGAWPSAHGITGVAVPGAEGTRPENSCTETIPFGVISKEGERPIAELGPSPGEPGGPPATRGEISEDEYVARQERVADYVSSAVEHPLARKDWDLLIVYIPLIDGLEHRYLLVDPRQVEYGDEDGARRARFARYIERGYRKIDAIVASWLAASPETDFL